eukprot:TRINITY_DN23088_c0_g1_i1.p1 TRINITY_DN23088_c0_g1~~TRINITY_DN23088_c0_g1_i1.p1  ORF type:complete len:656 (+),score=147.58 TRINITY_DN23088_c0_g1_i1:99-1970(+)
MGDDAAERPRITVACTGSTEFSSGRQLSFEEAWLNDRLDRHHEAFCSKLERLVSDAAMRALTLPLQPPPPEDGCPVSTSLLQLRAEPLPGLPTAEATTFFPESVRSPSRDSALRRASCAKLPEAHPPLPHVLESPPPPPESDGVEAGSAGALERTLAECAGYNEVHAPPKKNLLAQASVVMESERTQVSSGPDEDEEELMRRKNKRAKSVASLISQNGELSSTGVDACISIAILLNTCVLFAESQWKGSLVGKQIGVDSYGLGDWEHSELVFAVLNHLFNVIFTLELVFQLYRHRARYFCSPMNIFDFVVIAATLVDAYILDPLTVHDRQNLGAARLVRVFRVARILRVVRIVRYAKHLSQLRVLINSMTMCYSPLLWSFLVLGIVVIGSGILVAQIVASFLLDDSVDIARRLWVYEKYGDAARASYTMFEVTFSGSWPALSRPLVDDVSPWFSVLWIIYQLVIGFAIMRVIGAIFLSETIRAANNDAEMMVLQKIKEKEAFASKLHEFFEAADTSGDGFLSLDELQSMVEDPAVVAWLKVMELEIYEVMGLYRLLDDDGDGTVSYDEFLGGAVRLKGNARAIDSILIMHEQRKLAHCIEDAAKEMQLIRQELKSLEKSPLIE